MPKKIQTIFKSQRVSLGILFVSVILFSANIARADEAGTPTDSTTPTLSATPDPSTTAAPAPPGPIFIKEVMWQGSSVSSADEWLELFNNSDEKIDLSGWEIVDEYKNKNSPDAPCQGPPMVRIDDGQIAPQGHFLISNNSRDHLFSTGESVLNVDPDLVSSAVSLSNSNLSVGLCDASGKPLDFIGSGKSSFFSFFVKPNPKAFYSLYRKDFSLDGDLPEAWALTPEADRKNLDDVPDDAEVLNFASPTPSGRPQISNFVLADQSYELGAAKSFKFSYSQEDFDGDFSGVDIIANSGAQTLTQNLLPNQTGFFLPASSNCWDLSFLFIDEKNLSYEIDIPLKCYSTNSQIVLSEVLTSPQDRDWDGNGTSNSHDEWFELQNQSTLAYTMDAWSLKDASGKTAQISGTIPAGGFLVFYYKDTGVSLNNDGETLYLYDPGGRLVDSVVIPPLADNQSFAKFGDIWKKTSISTPGAENKMPEVLANIPASSQELNQQPDQSEAVDIEISKDVSSNEEITTQTVVEHKVIKATLASYLITNSTVLPRVDGAVMGSSDQRAQKPSKLTYNLLYFYFVLLAVVTISIFYWGIYGICRLE